MPEPIIVKERPGGKYTNEASNGRHKLLIDEPVKLGSADLGPTPFEYLSMALGGCTTITLRMYAERKGWSIDHIAVKVTHKKVQGEEGASRDVFTREITLEGELSEEQYQRALEIAEKCPVHKTLSAECEIVTLAAS